MTITAQALHISVPLVVAFHLFRVVVVNMGTQHLFTAVSWLLARRPYETPAVITEEQISPQEE